ncbi:unnamed protein product [Parnassius apollo]|uniref:(apollo) hypothetical protein n=1 Tax=Parnassius apollo TaxID=110799 RepID=A0A8S3XBU6_PARAO|nr:unnamed protein product [Parnassius apollo]
MKEKQSSAPVIPFERVNERVAAATGISLRTVARITNEGKLAEESSSKIVTPGKKRKTRKDKIVMDNFDIGVLRRKIHEFYSCKKEIPTVNKLLRLLKEEIGFTGSREILRQHIKKIGFRYKKTKSNRKVLMELNDITAWRALYLQTIKRNDETEKLPVVYLDETYIHSGHTAGKCWQDDDEEEYTRPQLLEIVNRYKPEPVYAVDAILKGLGHKISRLPPYHCDLNPIEMIWASMKHKVAEVNIGKPANQMPEMVQEAFNSIPVEEWRNHCAHVKKHEEEYRSKDGYLDAPFIVELCSESEESSDEDSQDESDEEFNSIEPLAIVHAEHNYSKKI